MNIHRYYKRSANVSFYASMCSLVLAILFTVLHIVGTIAGNILWLSLPFILLSLKYYLSFRTYESRMKNTPAHLETSTTDLLEVEHLLLAFLPAPSLRMLLFSKDGTVVGEIKDQNMSWYKWLLPNTVSLLLPKRYGLYDCAGNRLAEFQAGAGLWSYMSVKNQEGHEIGRYRKKSKKEFVKTTGMISKPDGTEWIPVKIGGLSSFHIKATDGKKLASFQTGWMPREWGKLFKDPNMPILTFNETADLKERLVILGFLSAIFHHVSN